VDWRDLEDFSEGVIALTGMPGGAGILSSAIEHSANPAEPIEAYGLTRRLMELYRGRLYLELAYHNNSLEKLVNRGLIGIAQRMDLPLVATGGVRFARPEDALAHTMLEAIGKGTRTAGVLGHPGRDGYDLPTLTVEETRAQAFLKSPQLMGRTFAQLPAALEASVGPRLLPRGFGSAANAARRTLIVGASAAGLGGAASSEPTTGPSPGPSHAPRWMFRHASHTSAGTNAGICASYRKPRTFAPATARSGNGTTGNTHD
jgi:hypothetical protein